MTEPVAPVAHDADAVAASDVPVSVPVAAPTFERTEADAIVRLGEDIAERAFHAAWQSAGATFAALWAASGVDVASLAHLSGTVKVVIPILAAAGASGLSAAKTVIVGYFHAKKAS